MYIGEIFVDNSISFQSKPPLSTLGNYKSGRYYTYEKGDFLIAGFKEDKENKKQYFRIYDKNGKYRLGNDTEDSPLVIQKAMVQFPLGWTKGGKTLKRKSKRKKRTY
jgi:hypothetical protein